MKVYVVMCQKYDDAKIEKVFSTEEKAKEYLKTRNHYAAFWQYVEMEVE